MSDGPEDGPEDDEDGEFPDDEPEGERLPISNSAHLQCS